PARPAGRLAREALARAPGRAGLGCDDRTQHDVATAHSPARAPWAQPGNRARLRPDPTDVLPSDPAGYSPSGTRPSRQAVSTGSTMRQHSSAASPRTDSSGSPSSTPASTSP